jgi:hypothetical protein
LFAGAPLVVRRRVLAGPVPIAAVEGEQAALAGLAGWAGSGVLNANEARIESALDPLRSRADFQLLLMDLAFPVEQFSRGTDANH